MPFSAKEKILFLVDFSSFLGIFGFGVTHRHDSKIQNTLVSTLLSCKIVSEALEPRLAHSCRSLSRFL